MSESVGVYVTQHVTRSLEEMRDPANAERWLNGERAREQASEIVLSIIAAAEARLNEIKED